MINFTRASTATYIDTGGILRVANINEPRFEDKGILIEGSSTNIWPSSEKEYFGFSFERIDYTKVTDSQGLIEHNLSFKQGSGAAYSYSDTFRFDEVATFSVLLKKVNASKLTFQNTNSLSNIHVEVDFDNQTIEGNYGSNPKPTLTKLDSGWFKFTSTATQNAGGGGGYLFRHVVVEGESTYDYVIKGLQVEKLPFATSYIPTNGTAVTRAADSLSLPKGTLEVNTSDISIFGEAVSYAKERTGYYHWLYAGTSSSTPVEFGYKGKILYAKYGVDPDLVVKEDMNEARMGLTYDRNSRVLKAYSGSNVGTHEYNSLPIDIGSVFIGGSVFKWFGHIKNFRVWNKVLTQNQISLLQGVV